MKISLRSLDTCLPDYFQGCSPDDGIVLAVAVTRETTAGQLAEGIRDEWMADSGDDERFANVETIDIEIAATQYIRFADAGGIFPHAPSVDDEEGDTVYHYVLVCPPEDNE